MLKIINIPLTVIPSEFEITSNDLGGSLSRRKEKYAQIEADTLNDLDQALSEGYSIVHTLEYTAERATWLRYTLHKHDHPVGMTSMPSEIEKADVQAT